MERRASLKEWVDAHVGALRRKLSTDKKRQTALEKVRQKNKENHAPQVRLTAAISHQRAFHTQICPQESFGQHRGAVHAPFSHAKRAALADVTHLYPAAEATQAQDDVFSIYTTTVSTPAEFESVLHEEPLRFPNTLDEWSPRMHPAFVHSTFEASESSLVLP